MEGCGLSLDTWGLCNSRAKRSAQHYGVNNFVETRCGQFCRNSFVDNTLAATAHARCPGSVGATNAWKVTGGVHHSSGHSFKTVVVVVVYNEGKRRQMEF